MTSARLIVRDCRCHYVWQVICVLEYRRLGRMSPGCVCDAATQSTVRRAHVMNSRRQRVARRVSVTEAPPETVAALDAITAVDAAVYRAAVLRVLCDIRALERATGARILCAPRLELLRNRTSYIRGLWAPMAS